MRVRVRVRVKVRIRVRSNQGNKGDERNVRYVRCREKPNRTSALYV